MNRWIKAVEKTGRKVLINERQDLKRNQNFTNVNVKLSTIF